VIIKWKTIRRRSDGIAARYQLKCDGPQFEDTRLPSPLKTWQESKQYILDPFFKDGEMNQGILRFAFLSLVRVAKGFSLAILFGTPLGFLLGLSPKFHQAFDPVIQVLRPISPLAWLPLGLVIFKQSEPAALSHRHLRHVADGDQHRRRGGQHQPGLPERRPRAQTVADEDAQENHDPGDIRICLPDFVSVSVWLGWIVAVMLTGSRLRRIPLQEYNSLVYSHILSVLAIGLIGFALDRLMSVIERRFKTA
jgi:nitrate/nitrite transport system permease protein